MRRKGSSRQICAGKEVDDTVPVTGVQVLPVQLPKTRVSDKDGIFIKN
jgi:hypothetical protein